MDPGMAAIINNGVLAVIAICTLIGTILQLRANKGIAATREAVAKQGDAIEKLEVNTNSIREQLVATTASASHAEGKAEGIAVERANPQAPATSIASQEPIEVKIIPDKAIPVIPVKDKL